MIFLNHLNLPSAGTQNYSEGIDKIFVYVAQEIPIFIPMILFALFMIIFLSGNLNVHYFNCCIDHDFG